MQVVDKEMTRDRGLSNVSKWNLIGDLIGANNIPLYMLANGLGRLHLETFCTELSHEAPSSNKWSQYFQRKMSKCFYCISVEI